MSNPRGKILLFLILVIIAVQTSLLPFLLISNVEMNKFIALSVSLGSFFIGYVLFWITKVTYRDIVGRFVKNNSRLSPIVKLIP